jgi:hypothetical protein
MNALKIETPVLPSTSPILAADAPVFRDMLNRTAFAFSHRLANDPLFALPRLIDLVKTKGVGEIGYVVGDLKAGEQWYTRPKSELSAQQLIERIECSQAWIIIRHIQADPDYAALVEQCLTELRDLAGQGFPRKMKRVAATLFVTSPNRITPFHLDRECNFLFQISGEKEICVFSRYDRDILSEEELERFWSVDRNVGVYKEQYQDRAWTCPLGPGRGVHIPVNCPHWVKNGDNISVSLSVNFEFPDSCLANVYRANHFLRKVGLTPLPPGRSRVRDTMKAQAMGLALGLRRSMKRIVG